VKQRVGNEVKVGGSNLHSLLRRIGRMALWAAVALLLARGLVSVVADSAEGEPAVHRSAAGSEDAVEAAAVRFARAYLEDPSPQALQPFLATGARIGAGGPPPAPAPGGAPAAGVRSSEVGDGRVIVTVACELRDSRTLYLAVPIVRFRAGEVAVLGAPSIVAVPAVAGADPARPQPIAGPGAAQIEALVAKFLPAYLAAGEASDLSYYLAAGAAVIPLGGTYQLLGVSGVSQLGSGEGAQRTVIADAQVRDPVAGGSYPLAYRLQLVRRGRWYVRSVKGALS
jgi:hypothetical protein